MRFLKVCCNRCPHYNECSQKTRMYVNYCGSSQKNVEEKIKKAIAECRERHGDLFQRRYVSESNNFSPDKPVPATFSF